MEQKKRRNVFSEKGRNIEPDPNATDRFLILDDTSLNLEWNPEPTDERES